MVYLVWFCLLCLLQDSTICSSDWPILLCRLKNMASLIGHVFLSVNRDPTAHTETMEGKLRRAFFTAKKKWMLCSCIRVPGGDKL
jgi:hypothetical protein